uniref:Histone domain-containing protein n=1 Tax=Angiostrongylus cantonensis TaxID=6313 RepID=A0A0K0DJ69_ANGCA
MFGSWRRIKKHKHDEPERRMPHYHREEHSYPEAIKWYKMPVGFSIRNEAGIVLSRYNVLAKVVLFSLYTVAVEVAVEAMQRKLAQKCYERTEMCARWRFQICALGNLFSRLKFLISSLGYYCSIFTISKVSLYHSRLWFDVKQCVFDLIKYSAFSYSP